jgi:hypothetical protein
MAEFTHYLSNRVLDHIFRAVASTAPASVWMALHTAVNADAAPGAVVTGGTYARQQVTFSVAASAGLITNSADVNFTATGSAYNLPVVSTSIYDLSSGGNQLCFDNDFTDTTVNQDDTLKFTAGDVDISLQ